MYVTRNVTRNFTPKLKIFLGLSGWQSTNSRPSYNDKQWKWKN